MIDYKIYQKVLWILKTHIDQADEKKASDICELFDVKQFTPSIQSKPYTYADTYVDPFPNRITCWSDTDKVLLKNY